MRGWFDAFRIEGGPTFYSQSNRTSVTGDVNVVLVSGIFCTLFIAFLIIFPGVRKERVTTFFSITLSLFVGAVILVTQVGSEWHVACTDVISSYSAYSKEKVSAQLGAYIGLDHVNITLNASPARYNKTIQDIDFNERFNWDGAEEMHECYQDALLKGLPFPILSVAEVLSLDQEGFCWGRQYREAGYYASIFLWSAFSTWILMMLLLAVVPRYGAYSMTITGLLMLSANLVYYWLLPTTPLLIRFEVGVLFFKLGWCFWLLLCTGVLCALAGLVISIIDLVFPHHFSTVLEVDYDTPYDRHVIIEDSNLRGRKKKSGSLRSQNGGRNSLEEPASLPQWGSRILRRISRRDKTEDSRPRIHGRDNNAFHMDPPKSPWNFPHHVMAHHNHKGLERIVPTSDITRQRIEDKRLINIRGFKRSDSQDSTASSNASSLGINTLMMMRRE